MLPADTFIVVNKTMLSDKDRNLLILLYQPIIGSTSISLYYTLWSYLDKQEILSNEWTHHHILRDMQISNGELNESIEKLEALGLIKTYKKEGNINNYVYELYSPLNAKEFFANPKHPYSIALLNAIPNNNPKLETIEGQPPAIQQNISGCRFHFMMMQKSDS